MCSNESVEGGILHNNLRKKASTREKLLGERSLRLLYQKSGLTNRIKFLHDALWCQGARQNKYPVLPTFKFDGGSFFNSEVVVKYPKVYSRYKYRGKYLTDCKR